MSLAYLKAFIQLSTYIFLIRYELSTPYTLHAIQAVN